MAEYAPATPNLPGEMAPYGGERPYIGAKGPH